MKLIVCENYDEMSRAAAGIFADTLRANPGAVLGLATGSTPIGLYQELVAMSKRGEIDFSKVTTVNLDEYYPIAACHPESYHTFMNENLFGKLKTPPKASYLPDGASPSPEEACREYDRQLQLLGAIDLQLLGIGQNGHIGFNEPADELRMSTHLTELADSTIEANSRFFDSKASVPHYALTMGIGSIMHAKKIVLLASGAEKQEAVRELFTDRVTSRIPASILKLHADLVLICDRAAYGFDAAEELPVD